MDDLRPGMLVRVESSVDGEVWDGVVEVVGPWPWPWPALEEGDVIVLRALPESSESDIPALVSLRSALARRGTDNAFPVKVHRSQVEPL